MPRRDLAADALRQDEDWVGNNAAFTCPACGKVFLVSAQLHRNGRDCPGCGRSHAEVAGGAKSGGTAIGIVQVFTKPELDAQLGRWPYWCQIRPKLMIRDFDRAPDLDVLNVDGGRDFRKTVMQMGYAILEDAEYQRAAAALQAAADASRGDIVEAPFA